MIEWYYIAKEKKAMMEQELVNEIDLREELAQESALDYSYSKQQSSIDL